jgi:hypothetical protein
MRIDEIDPGEKIGITGKRIETFIKLVQRDCSDAWNAYHKNYTLLFRGIKSGSGLRMFHGSARLDRRPLSTKKPSQIAIDNALQKCGFVALRSNSIFCTSNLSDAKSYGMGGSSAMIIFPKNGFHYTWSPEVGDLYIEIQKLALKPDDLISMPPEQLVEMFGFRSNEFDEALKSGNEIMITGEYYACNADMFEGIIISKMP